MNALTSFSADSAPFALPIGLRRRAGAMNWAAVTRTFSATSGPIRLGSWESRTARGGRTTYDATFGIGDSIHSATATTYGPIDALTSMLYDAGFHIEIISFHQQTTGMSYATFLLAEFDGRQEWSMAVGPTGSESSIRAVVGAANMLHR